MDTSLDTSLQSASAPLSPDTSFQKALAFTLQWEGGYVDNPNDPGGATNRGVTQAVYDAWRVSQQLPRQAVRGITDTEVDAIYKQRYWLAGSCQTLPMKLATAHFDWCVNGGVVRAVKMLQLSAGAAPDGKWGPNSQANLNTRLAQPNGLADTLANYFNQRQQYYQGLGTRAQFAGFLKGWLNRLNDLRTYVANEQE